MRGFANTPIYNRRNRDLPLNRTSSHSSIGEADHRRSPPPALASPDIFYTHVEHPAQSAVPDEATTAHPERHAASAKPVVPWYDPLPFSTELGPIRNCVQRAHSRTPLPPRFRTFTGNPTGRPVKDHWRNHNPGSTPLLHMHLGGPPPLLFHIVVFNLLPRPGKDHRRDDDRGLGPFTTVNWTFSGQLVLRFDGHVQRGDP